MSEPKINPPEIQQQRLEFCQACPLYSKTLCSGEDWVCDDGLGWDAARNILYDCDVSKHLNEEGIIFGCGCAIEGVIELEDHTCPMNNW